MKLIFFHSDAGIVYVKKMKRKKKKIIKEEFCVDITLWTNFNNYFFNFFIIQFYSAWKIN